MAHNTALLCVAFSIQRQKNPNKKGVSRCKSWPKNKSRYSRCATYNDKTQFLTSVHSFTVRHFFKFCALLIINELFLHPCSWGLLNFRAFPWEVQLLQFSRHFFEFSRILPQGWRHFRRNRKPLQRVQPRRACADDDQNHDILGSRYT